MLHEHSHECKFSFFAPHHLSVQKIQTSLITPNGVQVSPPPPSRIMTAYSLTEWQMAFVGPHHMPTILGKNHQSTTKVTLNEPPISLYATFSFFNSTVIVRARIRARLVCTQNTSECLPYCTKEKKHQIWWKNFSCSFEFYTMLATLFIEAPV